MRRCSRYALLVRVWGLYTEESQQEAESSTVHRRHSVPSANLQPCAYLTSIGKPRVTSMANRGSPQWQPRRPTTSPQELRRGVRQPLQFGSVVIFPYSHRQHVIPADRLPPENVTTCLRWVRVVWSGGGVRMRR